MTTSVIAGFSIGSAPVEQPCLTTAGRPEPLAPGRLHGWLVATGAAASGQAADGSATVVLAGELCHRERLQAALGGAAAGATTDAELALAAWQRYGLAGLRLLDGRFAVVLADGGRLVAATDHAGSVPLYVRRDGGAVRLATEAKALAGPGTADELPGTDGAGVIRRVRAGCALVLDRDRASATTTWRPPEHRVLVEPDAAVRAVRDTLDAAVRTRLDRDAAGPVTVVLSGGIDSSAVAALATHAGADVETVSLGTDAGDEFDAARLVAEHLGTRHTELRCTGEELVRQLPLVVAAAEIADADVLEYLLPLVVLYRALPGPGRRVLTGYGADIPLGGMHRGVDRLAALDAVIAHDMATFDGLNEMSPALGMLAGHWTTHPYWDRGVLDLLVSLEPGLKHRNGSDKWVLREAMRDVLPEATVTRRKLGIHEGSGTTSTWTAMLVDAGIPASGVAAAKSAMARELHRMVVVEATHPDDVSFDDVLRDVVRGGLAVTR